MGRGDTAKWWRGWSGQYLVHQAFWPRGLWAAYLETPYRLDLARAKALLAEAGHGGGFAVRIDTLTSTPYPAIAEAVAATFAEAVIEAEVVAQDGAELWPWATARRIVPLMRAPLYRYRYLVVGVITCVR